ncbi:ATPase [Aureococcus anophagefferens]|nr:ATPase [Aureococcus anophagefferens]
MLMSDAEVSATARIINNFVDLDYYDEDEEQEIFESGAAPESAAEADAAAFEKRMFDWLLERADLPYLDAADQRCVIHSLLVLLMRSMRKRKSAVGALSDLETHHLVLDVFVKSTIDIFNDAARRRQLAERIEAYVSAIPFFPTPVLAHVIDFFCGHASAVITPVLVETYDEHLRHSDAYAEMALRSAGEVAADAKPFEALARTSPAPRRNRPLEAARPPPLRVPDEADGRAAASVATAAAAAGAAKMRRKRRR